MQGAQMGDGDFERGDFTSASLQGATLTGGRFGRASFRSASLAGARLGGGGFADADFRSAELDGADLRGVDLSEARGLTQDQLDDACTDGATRLPGRLRAGGCRSGGGGFAFAAGPGGLRMNGVVNGRPVNLVIPTPPAPPPPPAAPHPPR